jgi:hypothetical protein
MRQDLLTNWIYKNLKGGVCPLHNDWFEPNGTGAEPDGTKLNSLSRWALAQMPWDDILNEEAVPVHDWRCHIGNHPSNLSFKGTTLEFEINVEKGIKRWVSSVAWYRRAIRKTAYFIVLRFLDEIYALAVGSTDAGRKAYDSNSCTVEGG